jgi:hypothetical protein
MLSAASTTASVWDSLAIYAVYLLDIKQPYLTDTKDLNMSAAAPTPMPSPTAPTAPSDSSNVARNSSAIGAVLLLALVAFQIALAAGAPWGRAAYGGTSAQPAVELRVSSAFAAVLWSFVALVVLNRGGHRVPRMLPQRSIPVVMWLAVALLSVGLVLNVITTSQLERMIWAPVTLALLVATTATELSARKRFGGF